MKTKTWHDNMVTVWVSPKTRDLINKYRDPESRRKTADDVIQDAIKALKMSEAK